MQEDMDFLLQCFEFLDEDEDELLTEDEIRIWLTVLNHGDEPTELDMENCIETLGMCAKGRSLHPRFCSGGAYNGAECTFTLAGGSLCR